MLWTTPRELAWGHWPCYTFSHCISVLTEGDAHAAYEFESSPGDSESEDESPLPPVYECLIDGVEHLWLIVPRRSAQKVNGLMQLSEEQMCAAMAFYRRTTTAGTGNAGAPMRMLMTWQQRTPMATKATPQDFTLILVWSHQC